MSTTATALKLPARGRGTRHELRRRVLRSRLPKSARLVGLVLAELMDKNDHYVITNNATLGKRAGLSVRQVQRATRLLVCRRYVRRTRPDGRFAWRYEPMSPRKATRSPRGVVVALRGDALAPQRDMVSPENTVLGSRFSNTKNKALSATRNAKAESKSKTKAPAAHAAAIRAALPPRGAPPAPRTRESQLEKQLALRERAGGRRR